MTTVDGQGAEGDSPEIAKLRNELTVWQMQVEVALAVVGVIYPYLDRYNQRAIVIASIVADWQTLDPATQQRYRDQARTASTLLQQFAEEYWDRMDQTALTLADILDGEAIPFDEEERLRNLCWHQPTP